MAVFRVERNRGYTVMSNHHLRNKELSLKAKGLLSQMLSLPEDWDYTLAARTVHPPRNLIDIHPDFLYLRCHGLYVAVVYLHDIAVYGDLPQIRRHVLCRYELHFFQNQIPFRFRHAKLDLHRPFPSAHAPPLLSV